MKYIYLLAFFLFCINLSGVTAQSFSEDVLFHETSSSLKDLADRAMRPNYADLAYRDDYDDHTNRAMRPDYADHFHDRTGYFRNHVYLEAWGYALLSINYQRLFPELNMALGGGFGPNPFARNFTLSGDGGVVANLHAIKQFQITDNMHVGVGVGGFHDFDGRYNTVWEPLFAKLTFNRYSVSPTNDRLYYGISLYFIEWENRDVRPSFKLGFSF
jgi:hypothetical protein